MGSEHFVYALESPWPDEKGRWFVGRGAHYLPYDRHPNYEWVLGASSDGSGAYLTENEAKKIAEALNA